MSIFRWVRVPLVFLSKVRTRDAPDTDLPDTGYPVLAVYQILDWIPIRPDF
jgi:hypothetical protein